MFSDQGLYMKDWHSTGPFFHFNLSLLSTPALSSTPHPTPPHPTPTPNPPQPLQEIPSMQQELWLRAISRVLSSSVKPVCVLRAASSSSFAVPSQLLSRPSASRSLVRVTEYSPQLTMSLSNSNHTSAYSMPPARTPNLSRTYNSHHSPSHHHHRDNGIKAEMKRSASAENLTAEGNPMKASRTHQELHKELLLAHKKGLGLSSRSELHQVLEKKKREKNHREEEQQTRGVLGQVLLRRQQQQLEKEKQEEDRTRDEAHMSEFVRVRQNLRKIHTALHSKASNS